MNCANKCVSTRAFKAKFVLSCDNPTLIINPYYKKDPSKGLNFLHDCSSQYIRVPCNHCPSCIATKQMYLLQRFYMESLDSYVFFSTLTYDDAHLPTLDVNGFNICYANFKHFTDMIKRIRKGNLFTRPFSYFAVSELGSKRGRPHFHALFHLPKYDNDTSYTPYNLEKVLYDVLFSQWKVKVSLSDKLPVYEPLFTFASKFIHGRIYSNFDLHYIKPSLGTLTSDSVAFYVMKYLLKSSTRERRLQQALKLNLEPFEYNEVWKTIRSHFQCSKFYGYGFNKFCNNCNFRCSKPSKTVIEYIRNGIKRTPFGSPYPLFFSPLDGSSYPLSSFYTSKSCFYSFDDALPILLSSNSPIISDLDDDFYQKSRLNFERFQKSLHETEFNGNPLLNY